MKQAIKLLLSSTLLLCFGFSQVIAKDKPDMNDFLSYKVDDVKGLFFIDFADTELTYEDKIHWFSYSVRDRKEKEFTTIDSRLVDVLRHAQRALGNEYFKITSGFRGHYTNLAIPNAAKDSWHKNGGALDLQMENVKISVLAKQLTKSIKAVIGDEYGRIIIYPSHIHLDIGKTGVKGT